MSAGEPVEVRHKRPLEGKSPERKIDAPPHARRDLPDGRWVEYTEEPRAYRLCADGEKPKRLPSVTTILSCIGKGDGLARWQQDQAIAGALVAVRQGSLDVTRAYEAYEALNVVNGLKVGVEEHLARTSKTGLTIHKAFEHWSLTDELPSPGDMDPTHRPFMPALASMLTVLRPEPRHVERITCHPELLFAGRFDLRATIDGKDTLLDLKVRAKPATRETDCLQLVGYAAAEHSLGEPWPDSMLAVAIGPDREVVAHEVNLPRNAFETVLRLYRLLSEVRKPLDAARRVAKKAAA